MITVTYHKKFHRVTVEGHAESGEFGRDLICAAVTVLTRTLAANVQMLSECLRDGNTVLEPGRAEISCQPKAQYRALLSMVFETVVVGYRLLGDEYPEFVRVDVRG